MLPKRISPRLPLVGGLRALVGAGAARDGRASVGADGGKGDVTGPGPGDVAGAGDAADRTGWSRRTRCGRRRSG
jgi:hypothetical protein